MDAPTISVAMATYNGAAYIEAQLRSIAAQTLLPAELVVNDDRSSDGTVGVVESFATRAPFPVRCQVNAARLGWRENFVRATARCTGDLIALCDQDDVWYPEKLAKVREPFRDEGVLLVYHNADLVDIDGKAYDSLLPIASRTERIAPLSRPTDWSNPLGLVMTFRRELTRFNDLWEASVDLSRPPNPAAHDQWFYFLATNLGAVVALPDRLLAYRQHGNNSVGWKRPEARQRRPDRAEITDALDRSIGMMRPFCATLSAIAERESDPLAGRARTAVDCNRRYLQDLASRRELYRQAGFGARAAALVDLLKRRAYGRGERWTLGRRALLYDLASILLRAHAS